MAKKYIMPEIEEAKRRALEVIKEYKELKARKQKEWRKMAKVQKIKIKDCEGNFTGEEVSLVVYGDEEIVFCQKMRDGNYFARGLVRRVDEKKHWRAIIFDYLGYEKMWMPAEPNSKEEDALLIKWLFDLTELRKKEEIVKKKTKMRNMRRRSETDRP